MRDGQVIALEVVVHVYLPVARYVVVPALDPAHVRHLVSGGLDLRRDGAYPIRKRSGVRVQVGEHEWTEGVDANRHEAEIGLVEILCAFHLASDLELAVETVDPPVVSALK